MDELVKVTNAISTCEKKDVAPQIMVFCRAITPQFYKNMTDLDVNAEKLSIQLLTQHIEQNCLAEMCRLAVINYARSRSEDAKVYFDINYILTFYKQAFNKLFCESVELPKNSTLETSFYDDDTKILTETYRAPDGQLITIKEIKEKARKGERTYSSKYFANLICQGLDDIEI